MIAVVVPVRLQVDHLASLRRDHPFASFTTARRDRDALLVRLCRPPRWCSHNRGDPQGGRRGCRGGAELPIGPASAQPRSSHQERAAGPIHPLTAAPIRRLMAGIARGCIEMLARPLAHDYLDRIALQI